MFNLKMNQVIYNFRTPNLRVPIIIPTDFCKEFRSFDTNN